MPTYEELLDEINAASLDEAVALLVHWVGIADSTGLERLRAPIIHHVIDRIVHLVKQEQFARHRCDEWAKEQDRNPYWIRSRRHG